MTGISILPFDRELHRAFVERTFLDSVRTVWPWQMVPDGELRYDLRRRLRRPEARIAVAVSDEDNSVFMGWAAGVPLDNEVIYAYTIADFRSKGRYQPRICTSLLSDVGIDLSNKTTVRYWTEVTRQLSTRTGYQLRHPVGP